MLFGTLAPEIEDFIRSCLIVRADHLSDTFDTEGRAAWVLQVLGDWYEFVELILHTNEHEIG